MAKVSSPLYQTLKMFKLTPIGMFLYFFQENMQTDNNFVWTEAYSDQEYLVTF